MTLLQISPGSKHNSDEIMWCTQSPILASQGPSHTLSYDNQQILGHEHTSEGSFSIDSDPSTDLPPSERPPKRLAATKARHTLAEAYAPLIVPFDDVSVSSSDNLEPVTEVPENTALPSDSSAIINSAIHTDRTQGIDIDSLLSGRTFSDEESSDDDFVGSSISSGRGQPKKRRRDASSVELGAKLRRKKVPRLGKDDMRLIAGTDRRKIRVAKRTTKNIAPLGGLVKAEAENLMAWIGAKMDWEEAATWVHSQRDKKDVWAVVGQGQPCVSTGQNTEAEKLRTHWQDVLSKTIPELYIA